jgi:hypothetical protein
MKKLEIFRKLLKTNPEKFRKEFGDDPENSGHFEGSGTPRRILGPFRLIPENFSQYQGVSGKGFFLPTGASQ